MLVGEITFKLVAATPPIVTLVVPSRSGPVIVINVPPKVEPLAGETNEIVGGATKVNAPLPVALPTPVTTTTSARPAALAGVTAVTLVDETTRTLVAATPPIVTLVVPSRSVPVIVINVPPKVEPLAGETNEIVGCATKVNALLPIALPTAVTTTTSATRPAAPAGVTAVMLVGEITFKLVAATPPIVTLVVPSRSVPVIVINVPPKVEPVAGETEEIVAWAYGTTPQ